MATLSHIRKRLIYPPGTALVLLFFLPICAAIPQDRTLTADVFMTSADSLARLGQIDDAIALYSEIPGRSADFIEARRRIGRLYIDRHQWSSALDEFLTILEKQPTDTAAHYNVAICYREKGKEAVFVNMLLGKGGAWYKSNEHFEWVITRDSSYADVLLQLAMLFQCREEYQRSIEIGRLQEHLKPGDPDVEIGLFRLYRNYIIEDPDEARTWLAAHPGDYSGYFLAEILRREKKEDEADSLFRQLVTEGREIPLQPVYLSLARIGYRRDEPRTAEQYYWRAVDTCTNEVGFVFLLEDLKYIFSDEELGEFFSLASAAGRRSFIHSFWSRKNPTPGSTTNVRLTQHEQRLLVAEERYEYTGFRTSFNNPDVYRRLRFPKTFTLNDQFNDKGLVYIRYGAPDISFTPHGFHNIEQRVDPEETWVYEKSEESPQKIVNFAKTGTLKNIYRFTPLPSDPAIRDQLASYDRRYMRLDPAVEDMIIDDEKKTVLNVLSTERYSYEEKKLDIHVPYSIDTFRAENGKDLVDVSFAVPMNEFRSTMPGAGDVLRSEISLVLRDKSDRIVASRFDTLSFRSSVSRNDADVGTYRLTVAPDTYSVSMLIKPIGGSVVAHWRTRRVIPGYKGPELMLSDIQLLLPSPEKGKLEVQGVKVGPNPFRVWPRRQPLYVYFHVYNLKRDETGKSSFETRYILRRLDSGDILNALSSLFRSKPQPSFQKESLDLGTDDFFQKFSVLDLQNLDPGRYDLEVQVTDRRTKGSCTRSVSLQLSE